MNGGRGGGGVQSAESPAKSRLRPVHAMLNELTAKVASMTASLDLKKSWTPRLACCSVSIIGSVGLSAESPRSVELNVRVLSLTCTVEANTTSFAGRRGVLK